ncbi:unnamed protein product [Allacma fusca]|uniref:BEN domain-containing protein n=1 Tax=Allacma fusca TaxID=39272 RepID=A0A8J2JJT7_9HEXA|nr:unnamed protein product [Allacma fusca]
MTTQKQYSPFFLVYWKEDNTYSCIPRENIVDGSKRKEADNILLAAENLELSFNRHIYNGKLLYAGGTKREVNSYLNNLQTTSEADSRSTVTANVSEISHKKKRIAPSSSEITDVLNQLNQQERNDYTIPNTETGELLGVNAQRKLKKLEKKMTKLKAKLENLEQELQDEKRLKKKYKDKVATLKRKLDKYQGDKTKAVDIGNGILINAALLDRAKIFSNSPAILARNMFRLAFTESEVQGRSLLGRACNANKGQPVKPSVDATKRDAVINYCNHCVKMRNARESLKTRKHCGTKWLNRWVNTFER